MEQELDMGAFTEAEMLKLLTQVQELEARYRDIPQVYEFRIKRKRGGLCALLVPKQGIPNG